MVRQRRRLPCSYQLVKDIIYVISELDKARPEPFDRLAQHRPCGLLEKYSASGMLLCDALGLWRCRRGCSLSPSARMQRSYQLRSRRM
mmetsp:Transcript_21657/g.48797  ORF Transcript_21657/g.48797 Transcript_21657/m.48797 type:complete len:88 (-) Transcript_21657:419-682(-)